MPSKLPNEIIDFFTKYIAESDNEKDIENAKRFSQSSKPELLQKIKDQLNTLSNSTDVLLENLGMNANRWFVDIEEAKNWIQSLVQVLNKTESKETAEFVKDSNGTQLSEGDAVQVIKDLKVKGGSSDLKRGTIIKNIHLIEDTDVIECRVDGSTLVLKTIFLKKA